MSGLLRLTGVDQALREQLPPALNCCWPDAEPLASDSSVASLSRA